MARSILSESTLNVAGDACRIREVELYLHDRAGHADPFAHCAPEQASEARWYFHRQGRGYRGGSFKGLDVTFGPSGTFGGILIRSLSLPDGRLVNGCSLCVDWILERSGCQTVAGLDALLGDVPVFASTPLRLEAARSVQDATIWETARVGLTLRRVDQHPEMRDYFARPYRFLNAPREIKKGRPQLVIAMHQKAMSAQEIHTSVGTPARTISAWTTAYERGLARRDRAESHSEKLSAVGDLCRLLGRLEPGG